MLWLRLILALIGAAWFAAPAQARVQHPPTAFFCPFGWTGVDNCLQAPQPGLTPGVNGTWQQSCFAPAGNGWINQVSGVSTDYTNARHSNIAGCDFPVGALNSPAPVDVATNVPSACTYNPTGGTNGNPLLTCGSTVTDAMLSGLDFSGNGTHGCVNLALPASLSGSRATLTIFNSIFTDNTGLCSTGTNGPIISEGGNTNYRLILKSVTATGMGAAARNSAVDGQAADGLVHAFSGLSLQFSALYNFPGRPVSFSPNSASIASPYTNSDSMIAGWALMDHPDEHGEWLAGAPLSGTAGYSAFNFTDVTQVNLTSTMARDFQTAPVTCCLGFVAPIQSMNFTGNFVVNSRAGGASKTATLVTGCIGGAPPVGGVCDMTTHGSNLYIISVTGTAGTGEDVAACTARARVGIGTNISGGVSAGPGGGYNFGNGTVAGLDSQNDGITGLVGSISGNTLSITTAGNADLQVGSTVTGSGVAAGTTVTAIISPAVGGVGSYTVSGSPQTVSSESLTATFAVYPLAGRWSMAPQSCNNVALTSDTSWTSGAMYFGNNGIPTVSSIITDNSVDMSAVTSGNIWYSANSTCTNPTTFARNTDPSGAAGAKPNNWTGTTSCTP